MGVYFILVFLYKLFAIIFHSQLILSNPKTRFLFTK